MEQILKDKDNLLIEGKFKDLFKIIYENKIKEQECIKELGNPKKEAKIPGKTENELLLGNNKIKILDQKKCKLYNIQSPAVPSKQNKDNLPNLIEIDYWSTNNKTLNQNPSKSLKQ